MAPTVQPRFPLPHSEANNSSSSDDTIFWSKTEFTIPFHVDGSGRQPAEVQLEVLLPTMVDLGRPTRATI